ATGQPLTPSLKEGPVEQAPLSPDGVAVPTVSQDHSRATPAPLTVRTGSPSGPSAACATGPSVRDGGKGGPAARSQTRTSPSVAIPPRAMLDRTVSSRRPSALKASRPSSACPASRNGGQARLPVVRSQTTAVPLPLNVAASRPSGLSSAARKLPSCR